MQAWAPSQFRVLLLSSLMTFSIEMHQGRTFVKLANLYNGQSQGYVHVPQRACRRLDISKSGTCLHGSFKRLLARTLSLENTTGQS